jgi:hypothetical protein
MEYYETKYKTIEIVKQTDGIEKRKFEEYMKLSEKADTRKELLISILKGIPIAGLAELIIFKNLDISFNNFDIFSKIATFFSPVFISIVIEPFHHGIKSKLFKVKTVGEEVEDALKNKEYPNEKKFSKRKYGKIKKRLAEIFNVSIEEVEAEFDKYVQFMNFINIKREIGRKIAAADPTRYPREVIDYMVGYNIYIGEELVTLENVDELLPEGNVQLIDGHNALNEVRNAIKYVEDTGNIEKGSSKREEFICETIKYLRGIEKEIMNSRQVTPVVARVKRQHNG